MQSSVNGESPCKYTLQNIKHTGALTGGNITLAITFMTLSLGTLLNKIKR